MSLRTICASCNSRVARLNTVSRLSTLKNRSAKRYFTSRDQEEASNEPPGSPKSLDDALIRQRISIIGSDLKINNLEQWYSVKRNSHWAIDKLCRDSSMSLESLLRVTYPDHPWQPWRFPYVPHGYWEQVENQRLFLDWAIEQLSKEKSPPKETSKKLALWYRIDKVDLKNLGGTRLMNIYGDSMERTLAAVYPAHEFLPWKFRAASRQCWADRANHRRFFEYLANELGWSVSSPEPWYQLSSEIVAAHDGSSLIQRYYGNSASFAVMEAFPEHNWQPWRFNVAPRGWWDSLDNQRRFLLEHLLPKFVEARYGKSTRSGAGNSVTPNQLMDEIYELSIQDIKDLGATSLYSRYHSIAAMAQAVFPDHPWEISKFGKKAPN
eukprot:TRINITY_DN15262_c0_g1_i1.p1 TRINITY_DN15262_c0_g1~~TRINITY_DN15262_c0_g1_i1.p1  ORF type:complete len:380 (+),score=37.42 TRINITY_DN15262_c0_g1_i1:113-1252(+)